MSTWLVIGLAALMIALLVLRRSRMQAGPRHAVGANRYSSDHDYQHHQRSANDDSLTAGMLGAATVGMVASETLANPESSDEVRWGEVGGGGGSWDNGGSDSGSSSWGGDSGGGDSGGGVD